MIGIAACVLGTVSDRDASEKIYCFLSNLYILGRQITKSKLFCQKNSGRKWSTRS